MSEPLRIVLRCDAKYTSKARYVLDTLFMAAGVSCYYADSPAERGPWLLYGEAYEPGAIWERCLAIAHIPSAWRFLSLSPPSTSPAIVNGVMAAFPQRETGFETHGNICFDMLANAFYLLASWSERMEQPAAGTRQLFKNSVYSRMQLPQNAIDQYLERLLVRLRQVHGSRAMLDGSSVLWPNDSRYALVLSHDVDFLPGGILESTKQAAKTLIRHAIRERSPGDALRAGVGFLSALIGGRDPYGCVPEIIARERQIGVRSSFQVAVGHRHPADVNYRIEEERVRDYLRVIPDSGFDLCLHGSYRSTEEPAWYMEEVELLGARLNRPLGSRQHFLSFDYDNLFSAQEAAGIQYDMSMGYPDHVGPRAGFSHPYFPYSIRKDRPYDILQISLVLMDVTLRSYMRLQGQDAWDVVKRQLEDLRRVGGCGSVVWHPIVFGGARDPGSEQLFWRMIAHVMETGGLATDGRTVNALSRRRAVLYDSFSRISLAHDRS